MSVATKTSNVPLESHDAPRVAPAAQPEVAVHPGEAEVAGEPLEAVLDNPYDNVACTD